MMAAATLTLSCDTSPLMTFLALFKHALESSKRSLQLGDLGFELVRVEHDYSAAGAGELLVRLYPSDAFLRFAATIFARELNLLSVEQAHGDLRGMPDV